MSIAGHGFLLWLPGSQPRWLCGWSVACRLIHRWPIHAHSGAGAQARLSNSPAALCRAALCHAIALHSGKGNRPLFADFGPGDRLIPSSSPLASRGDGAPTRRIARIAPGGARLAPDDGRETSRPAPCGAPTRHLRLTPQSAIGPHQELSVPGGWVPRPPVVRVCVDACRRLPAPGPRSQDAS